MYSVLNIKSFVKKQTFMDPTLYKVNTRLQNDSFN